MKKILLTLLIILPLAIFCQSSDTTKAKRIAMGFTFSPDYCYRILKSDASADQGWLMNFRDSIEFPRIGFTTGLSFIYNFSKRFALEVGLHYSDKGYKINMIEFIYTQPSPNPVIAESIKYHYIYFDIPIKTNYYLFSKRAKIFISAGISPSIFLRQKTEAILEYSDGQKKETFSSGNYDYYRNINLTFTTSLGFSYNITKNIYFRIEPTYRRSIIPIVDAPIKEYLYSVGLNSGIYYKL